VLRLIAKRKSQVVVAASTDTVLFGLSLPSDTIINSIRLHGQILPPSAGLELTNGDSVGYGLEAWILPIDDPDATADFDDVWDTLVPKDSDVQTLDLDAEIANTDTFYEPGEADWQAIFDVGLRPKRIWRHYRDLTINTTMGMKFVDSQTPFEPKWQPGDTFRFSDNKRYRIEQPSVLLVGVGVPAGDDTQTVVELPLSEAEWPRVKYLGETLTLALHEVLGLTEAGSETPWEEAADLLQRHLDPDVLEITDGFYNNVTLKCMGEMTVDHSVVGDLQLGTISTGR